MLLFVNRRKIMQEVSITTEGIQKNLKNFKPLDALCEYIWNGFDAQANKIAYKSIKIN